jgi:hypothetical protein
MRPTWSWAPLVVTVQRCASARAGFEPVGEPEPLRPGSELLAQPMRLKLRSGANFTRLNRGRLAARDYLAILRSFASAAQRRKIRHMNLRVEIEQ